MVRERARWSHLQRRGLPAANAGQPCDTDVGKPRDPHRRRLLDGRNRRHRAGLRRQAAIAEVRGSWADTWVKFVVGANPCPERKTAAPKSRRSRLPGCLSAVRFSAVLHILQALALLGEA